MKESQQGALGKQNYPSRMPQSAGPHALTIEANAAPESRRLGEAPVLTRRLGQAPGPEDDAGHRLAAQSIKFQGHYVNGGAAN